MECYYCKGTGKSTDKKQVESLYKYYEKRYLVIPEWQKMLIEQCPYCHGGGVNEVYNDDGSFKRESYWDGR
jgi:RecJ-like exonuclease